MKRIHVAAWLSGEFLKIRWNGRLGLPMLPGRRNVMGERGLKNSFHAQRGSALLPMKNVPSSELSQRFGPRINMMAKRIIGFEISTSTREDGTLEAVYIKLAEGKVAKTVEIRQDIAMLDLDSSGAVLGIELLGPIRLSKLTPYVDASRRQSFRKAVKNAVPPALVYA